MRLHQLLCLGVRQLRLLRLWVFSVVDFSLVWVLLWRNWIDWFGLGGL
jgi:hypothetical protein